MNENNGKAGKASRARSHAHRIEKRDSLKSKAASIRREMFKSDSIPAESKKIIENFEDIVADVRNLSGKQKVSLYGAIKNLSHQLTDDRNSRRLGYMNEASFISAYISYFMWWNLVRQVSLFSNLPKSAFTSLENSENPVAIDVGSGTLTAVIALWLARPELRSKKITWYCMDLSQTALAAGEDLYLSIAAKTLKGESLPLATSADAFSATPSPGAAPQAPESTEPWKIVRVKGAFGTSIKEKADFITCANVFNEIIQNKEMPTDFLAKKYTKELLSYLKSEDSAVLLVEPGDPHSARFISLMRDALIRQNYSPVAPCPHSEACPMAGRTSGKTTNAYGKNAKWCNFAFDTEAAPAKLLKLSEKAGLPKERASLSFIVVKKAAEKTEKSDKKLASEKTFIRIASDFIRLPELHKSGYYACSQFGMLLAVDESHVQPKNGELLQIKTPSDLTQRDKKSGAIIVRI
ncbi:small ribosomal subunit Rsm22 family protein [Treponema ruminis]|uniref:Ribosomal protein RSM22 (Predicted rRNA methylase) n=1 Tax=Treponema ruminis TaxID=744515 RepID=A0A7W8LKT4_9SPIR|nr:small ribosomal subunit Rsm22 family protein [Treponema ruminis]MBB5224704.1 ribosomal protein RSM22 (predicted rRNA methylase) [Treponema ruminis]